MDPIIGAALIGGAANFGIGMVGRHDQLNQQRKANRLASDQLYNSAQIRRRDFEAAGLHPSLAVGGQAHTPLPSSNLDHMPQMDVSTVLQSALQSKQLEQMDANIAETQARTLRTKQETELAFSHYHDIDLPSFKIKEQQEARSQVMHQIDVILADNKLSQGVVDLAIKDFERAYINDRNAKMPTDNTFKAAFEESLSRSGISLDEIRHRSSYLGSALRRWKDSLDSIKHDNASRIRQEDQRNLERIKRMEDPHLGVDAVNKQRIRSGIYNRRPKRWYEIWRKR